VRTASRGKALIKKPDRFLNTQRVGLMDDHLHLAREGKLFADGIAADMFF